MQRKEPDALAAGGLLYLGLPNLLFLGTWFKPGAGWLAVLLLAWLMLAVCSRLKFLETGNGTQNHWMLLLVATAWTLASGLGGLAYANTDWNFRFAVLRDLSVTAWPPAYPGLDSGFMLMRAPVAYYLPAAVAGGFMGVEAALSALVLWTVLGVWIFLRLLPLSDKSVGVRSLQVAVVILFSGMDILGYFAHVGIFPPWHLHIEWWGQYFQYSSMTTQLFWVPNHALGAWIATALIVRHFGSDGLGRMLPLLLALLPLWSPLSAAGALPFAFVHWAWRIRTGKFKRAVDIPVPVAAGVTVAVLPVLLYLAAGAHTINAGTTVSGARFALTDFVADYVLFVMLEFGLVSLLLVPRDQIMRSLFCVAVVSLLLLPLLRLGPSNDIVMRASIPALLVLLIVVLQMVEQGGRAIATSRRWLLAICLAIGAITPVREIYRGLSQKPWLPDGSFSLADSSHGRLPAHYVAVVSATSLLGILLNPPSLIPGRTQVQNGQLSHPAADSRSRDSRLRD